MTSFDSKVLLGLSKKADNVTMVFAWSESTDIFLYCAKAKALASKPQVLENCPVLGSRTALFFEFLKFCRSPEKFFEDLSFCRSPKNFFENLFFGEHLRLYPRSLALALSIPVLGLGKAVLRFGSRFFCVLGLGLEPCVLDSTSASTCCKNTRHFGMF